MYRAARVKMQYDATINPGIDIEADETAEKDNFKFEKPLKRILLICSLILFGELIWLFVINPSMPLRTVDIKGLDGISRAVVLEQAGITSRSSFMSLNAQAVEISLARIPQIEKAELVKTFPDSVEIILTKRVPVAMSLAQINGRPVPLYFDRNGVLFKIGADGLKTIPLSIPIISGIVFENVSEGLRLPPFLLPLFGDLDTILQSSPEILSAISEINVKRRQYGTYDLTLYPVNNPVKIRVGQNITEDGLRYLLLLMDVLKEEGLDVDEIDFRAGTASYRVKS
jgi:cell division protein FtsQ